MKEIVKERLSQQTPFRKKILFFMLFLAIVGLLFLMALFMWNKDATFYGKAALQDAGVMAVSLCDAVFREHSWKLPLYSWQGDGTTNDSISFQHLHYSGLSQPRYSSGVFDSAFDLDAQNKEYFILPAEFISPSQFSLSFWFKTAQSGALLGQLGSSTEPPNSPNGYVPAIYIGSDGLVYIQPFWYGKINQIKSTITVTDDQFHHLALTVSPSESGSEIIAYLDGVEIGKISGVFFVSYGSKTYTHNLGRAYGAGWPQFPGSWSYFKGQLDEIALYDRALAVEEVAVLSAQCSLCTDADQDQACTETVGLPAGMRGGDCHDNDNMIFPTQVERCDGIDNNCDTLIDSFDGTTVCTANDHCGSYENTCALEEMCEAGSCRSQDVDAPKIFLSSDIQQYIFRWRIQDDSAFGHTIITLQNPSQQIIYHTRYDAGQCYLDADGSAEQLPLLQENISSCFQGQLNLPATTPAGTYTFLIDTQDISHNQDTRSATLVVTAPSVLGDTDGNGCVSAIEYNDFKIAYLEGTLPELTPIGYNDFKIDYLEGNIALCSD